MATATGKVDYRRRGERARESQNRERPPERFAVEPECFGQVREHPLLQMEDQLEEAPGNQRRDNAEGGGYRQQGEESSAAKDRKGIQGSWGVLSHGVILAGMVVGRPNCLG